MKDSVKQENVKMLYKAILSLQNEEECAGFFKDLCTDTELFSMAQRFMVAKMVASGKKYDEIFMIDDNLKNLEVLPGIGITPVLFTDVDSMLEALGEKQPNNT